MVDVHDSFTRVDFTGVPGNSSNGITINEPDLLYTGASYRYCQSLEAAVIGEWEKENG